MIKKNKERCKIKFKNSHLHLQTTNYKKCPRHYCQTLKQQFKIKLLRFKIMIQVKIYSNLIKNSLWLLWKYRLVFLITQKSTFTKMTTSKRKLSNSHKHTVWINQSRKNYWKVSFSIWKINLSSSQFLKLKHRKLWMQKLANESNLKSIWTIKMEQT